jgi:hypothetical protein
MTIKNDDRFLYWFRKVEDHPDPDIQQRAEAFLDRVATELSLRRPYPRIVWFRPEDATISSKEWNRDRKNNPDANWGILGDPFATPSALFRFTKETIALEVFGGYTHAAYTGVVGIAIGSEGNCPCEAIAHECRHVAQDQIKPGWRMANCDQAEKDADAFVGEIRNRRPEWFC